MSLLSNKSRAISLFKELDLQDEWSYESDGSSGYDINNKTNDTLRFYVRNIKDEISVEHTYHHFFPFISYIINQVCPQYDARTYFIKEECFKWKGKTEDELFELSLPIWKKQWQMLKGIPEKFSSPQNLFEAESESSFNENLYYGSFFFGQSYNIKSLILAKLIGEETYTKRKDLLQKLIPVLDPHPKIQEYKQQYLKLIPYLDEFDSQQYLKAKPWLTNKINSSLSHAISLKRTAILAISQPINYTFLANLVGADLFNTNELFIAAESAIMSFSNEEDLHILQLKPTVIAFIQNPLVYEVIDLKKSKGKAIKFVIDEGASDSLRIDYYKDGIEQFSYLYSMGEELESLKHKDFDLNIDDPRAVIDILFERIAGRRLDEIKEDEEGYIYRLKSITA